MVVPPTWPPRCVTRECGSLRNSSMRPSSTIRSSVDGCTVSPRKSRRKSACFSNTVTATPARASRKPSIIPAGPPPAMQQVVLMEAAAISHQTGPAADWFRPLGLLLGRAHDQPIELVGDLDLARQPRIGPHVVTEIEHVLFHRRWFAGLLAPGFVDINVAGGAGAGTAALRLNAGNIV